MRELKNDFSGILHFKRLDRCTLALTLQIKIPPHLPSSKDPSFGPSLKKMGAVEDYSVVLSTELSALNVLICQANPSNLPSLNHISS